MQRIFIRITDNAGGEVLAGEYDLPAIFGRGAAATVRFDQGRTIISRKHAELQFVDGKLVLTHLGEETSTIVNGAQLHGPGARETIISGDKIRIGDHVVEVGATSQDIDLRRDDVFAYAIVSHHNHSTARAAKTLGVGRSGLSIVIHDADGSFFVRQVQQESTQRLVATLIFGGSSGSLKVEDDADLALIKVNTEPVRLTSVDLEHFDVIRIGNLRIEITGVEPVVLRCINEECGRINPYRPDENCKYCGYRLVESQSVYLPHSKRSE